MVTSNASKTNYTCIVISICMLRGNAAKSKTMYFKCEPSITRKRVIIHMLPKSVELEKYTFRYCTE